MGASWHCAIHAQEAFSMIHQASWGQRNGACSLQGCLWALSPHNSPWATEAQVESKPQLGLGLPLTPMVYSVSCTGGLDEVSMHCLKPRVSHDLWNLSDKKPATACPPAGGGRGLPVRPAWWSHLYSGRVTKPGLFWVSYQKNYIWGKLIA